MWLNYLFVFLGSFIGTVASEYGKQPLENTSRALIRGMQDGGIRLP
jgi:hypothetical protein